VIDEPEETLEDVEARLRETIRTAEAAIPKAEFVGTLRVGRVHENDPRKAGARTLRAMASEDGAMRGRSD
jgi:hypothetical protein